MSYNGQTLTVVSPLHRSQEIAMRIACLGGGPAGLYFAISLKLRDPSADIVVIELNKFDDTFGWGVALSDKTLPNARPYELSIGGTLIARFLTPHQFSVTLADHSSTTSKRCKLGFAHGCNGPRRSIKANTNNWLLKRSESLTNQSNTPILQQY